MKTMKNSGIPWIKEIPLTWNILKIKYISKKEYNSFVDGDWIESEYIADSGIRYLTSGNIGDGVFKNQGDGFITKETFNKLRCKYAYPGDLVFSRLNAPYGRSCILPNIEEKYVLAVDNVILRTDANSQYICYVTQCLGYQHSVEDCSSGMAMKRISRTKLGNINIPYPPLEKQQQIAHYLDKTCKEINDLLITIEKEIEILNQYKKSIITETVTKGLNKNIKLKNSGIEWAKHIPEHWEVSRIANVYKLRNQKVSDKDFEPLSVTMKGIFPQLENVAKSDAHDDRKLVRKGDFAINSRSDRRGSCGISDRDGSVSLINLVLQPLTNMNPNYYNWLFHTESFADEFYKWGHGIVNDLWTTNWQDMKRILIPQPPIQEQREMAEYLDKKCKEIDSILEDKNKQLETLESYKKSIIYEYVTGKKEVVDD